MGYIVDSLTVANEEEFHDLFVLRDGRGCGVGGGLQPWALRGKTQSQRDGMYPPTYLI